MSAAQADLLQTVLIAATLWVAGIGLGLRLRPHEIISSLRRFQLLGRILVLDLLLVPLAMWLAVHLLVEDPAYRLGLMLVAVAAAGPLGIKLTHLARGAVGFAIGLVVVLELANVIVVPVWATLFEVDDVAAAVVEIFRTLVLLIVAPLGVGILLARLRLALDPWSDVLERVSNVGVLVVVGFIVIRHFDLLGEALSSGIALAGVLVVLFALVAGWLMGGPKQETRISTSLVTAVRANAAALAIASTTFADEPRVAVAVVVTSLISVVLPSAFAFTLALQTRSTTSGLGGTRD